MALQPTYTSISSLSNRNGEVKNACNVRSRHLLLDIFSNETIKKKIAENKCSDIWDIAKQYKIVNTDIDSLRAIFDVYKIDCNHKGEKYTKSTPLLVLFQDLMEYVSPQLRAQINSRTQFHQQLNMLCKGFIESPRFTSKIIVSTTSLLKNQEIVDKLLDIFKNAELTEQVNREELYKNKGLVLWNYVKFNYSNAVHRGLALNEDVVSVIKSFIPTETRMAHLRLRYTDNWLREGLMKKNKKRLRMIIVYINSQHSLTRAPPGDNAIALKGSKGDQVLNIVKLFSKVYDISRGGSFIKTISGKSDTKVILESYLPAYKQLTFKFFLLLVSIIKNPSKKLVSS